MPELVNKVMLNKSDVGKWKKNLIVFLAPVGVVYIVAVVGAINAANGAVALKDFIPTPFTMGAMTLYVLNSALDYLKKLTAK